MGLYGSATASDNLCSMHLRISFSELVHSSVHVPPPFGESNCSMGWILCLKLGINGDAHSNLPTVYCSSCKVPGISVPNQFLRLFLASL
jgi:hypothetical protein